MTPLEELRKLLKDVEWTCFDGNESRPLFCPCCGGHKPGEPWDGDPDAEPGAYDGHAEDCRLGLALKSGATDTGSGAKVAHAPREEASGPFPDWTLVHVATNSHVTTIKAVDELDALRIAIASVGFSVSWVCADQGEAGDIGDIAQSYLEAEEAGLDTPEA